MGGYGHIGHELLKISAMTKAAPEKMYSPEDVERLHLLGEKANGKSAYSARHIRRLCEKKIISAIDAGTRKQYLWKIPHSALAQFLKRR